MTKSVLEDALKEARNKSWTGQVIVAASSPKSSKTKWVKLSDAKRIIRKLTKGMEENSETQHGRELTPTERELADHYRPKYRQ